MQKTNPLLRTAAALTLCALLLSLSGCKLIITRELTELRYNQSRVEAMAKKYMEEKCFGMFFNLWMYFYVPCCNIKFIILGAM